jgi:hypothetical protein
VSSVVPPPQVNIGAELGDAPRSQSKSSKDFSQVCVNCRNGFQLKSLPLGRLTENSDRDLGGTLH